MTPSLRGPVMPPMTAQIFASNFEDFSPNKHGTGGNQNQPTTGHGGGNHYYNQGA